MKSYGKDSSIYCWARGEPFECREAESKADETSCIEEIDLSPDQAPTIETCMWKRGWIPLLESVLHVNDG